MTFVLSHELAHVACGDIDEMNRAKLAGAYISTHDRLTEELRADEFAAKTILEGVTDQQTFINRGMGIVVGVMCLLLLKKGLSSEGYPDVDERIENAMNAIGPDDANGLWLVGLAAIKLWDIHYDRQLNWPEVAETPKQAFKDILEELRRSKD